MFSGSHLTTRYELMFDPHCTMVDLELYMHTAVRVDVLASLPFFSYSCACVCVCVYLCVCVCVCALAIPA